MNRQDREETLLRALKFQLDEVASEEAIGELQRNENERLRRQCAKLHQELTAAIMCARRIALWEAVFGRSEKLEDFVRRELERLVHEQRRIRGGAQASSAGKVENLEELQQKMILDEWPRS